jgi:hypothetical protein
MDEVIASSVYFGCNWQLGSAVVFSPCLIFLLILVLLYLTKLLGSVITFTCILWTPVVKCCFVYFLLCGFPASQHHYCSKFPTYINFPRSNYLSEHFSLNY